MTDPTAQEGMAYTLRQATDADYAFLYHLHRATLKDYIAQTWGWNEEVQATMFKARFDPAGYQIVVVEGRDVGALVIEQRTDALVLANIQILPEYQGHGLGTAVIKAILEQAHREGVPVTLRVCKDARAYGNGGAKSESMRRLAESLINASELSGKPS